MVWPICIVVKFSQGQSPLILRPRLEQYARSDGVEKVEQLLHDLLGRFNNLAAPSHEHNHLRFIGRFLPHCEPEIPGQRAPHGNF